MALRDKNTNREKFFFRLVLLSFASTCLFASNCPAQQQAPLQGFVEQYAQESKPLDPLLWPGNKFDREVARSLLRDREQESGVWSRIPEWQSGKWQGNQAVNTRAIKYMNGLPVDCQPIGVHDAADMFIKGIVRDKKGDIWHWFKSDYWSETDHGDELTESYVLYSSPGGGDYRDFFAESVDFNVDKMSNRILALRRAKAWTRYINLSPGMMKEETVRSNFDLQGHPTATTFNTAVERRIKPFEAYAPALASKKPIMDEFVKWLHGHGLDSLIPVASHASAPAVPASKHHSPPPAGKPGDSPQKSGH